MASDEEFFEAAESISSSDSDSEIDRQINGGKMLSTSQHSTVENVDSEANRIGKSKWEFGRESAQAQSAQQQDVASIYSRSVPTSTPIDDWMQQNVSSVWTAEPGTVKERRERFWQQMRLGKTRRSKATQLSPNDSQATVTETPEQYVEGRVNNQLRAAAPHDVSNRHQKKHHQQISLRGRSASFSAPVSPVSCLSSLNINDPVSWTVDEKLPAEVEHNTIDLGNNSFIADSGHSPLTERTSLQERISSAVGNFEPKAEMASMKESSRPWAWKGKFSGVKSEPVSPRTFKTAASSIDVTSTDLKIFSSQAASPELIERPGSGFNHSSGGIRKADLPQLVVDVKTSGDRRDGNELVASNVSRWSRKSKQKAPVVEHIEQAELDPVYRIKDLDTGKEFIVDTAHSDLGVASVSKAEPASSKVMEALTGREVTVEEFEDEMGISPVMKEMARREKQAEDTEPTVQEEEDVQQGKKKGSKRDRFLKVLSGLKAVHVSVKRGVTGSREATSVESTPESEDREGQMRQLIYLGRRVYKGKIDAVDVKGPSSIKRPRVQVHKKALKELSDLQLGQQIRGHQGSIWTIKFNCDGRFLASAGQDKVVRVWEVLSHHPLTSETKGEGQDPAVVHKDNRVGVMATSDTENREDRLQPVRRVPSVEGEITEDRTALRHHDTYPEASNGSRAINTGGSQRSSNVAGNRVWTGVDVEIGSGFCLSEIPLREFEGHKADVLDVSWSKSQQFLLSASMDKTVRLWHVSVGECLRVFEHADFVTCIDFSPSDDTVFASGSLDEKVRLWSIPEHTVINWQHTREMVTAISFSPDGQRLVVGSYKGSCRFYKCTDHKLELETQVDVRSSRGKNARGKKISGLQCMEGFDPYKVLVSSTDSRIRMYEGGELQCKFKGHHNSANQSSATLSADGKFIVCASEDSRIYLWNCTPIHTGYKKGRLQTYEFFESHNATSAIFWPGQLAPALPSSNELEKPGEPGDEAAKGRGASGMVIVAAGHSGDIITYQNFGPPVAV